MLDRTVRMLDSFATDKKRQTRPGNTWAGIEKSLFPRVSDRRFSQQAEI